jgi:YfiR/HmsC-like
MNQPHFKKLNLRTGKRFGQAMALLVFMAGLSGVDSGFAGESPASEYQVKAIFLLNFAKYVEWPATAFTNDATPITIGVLGIDPFGDNLQNAVKGKTINGRTFVVKHLAADSDLSGCQILFISGSEAARMGEILEKAGALPLLTVSESEEFAKSNGIIQFVLKDGKVRLEIDLTSAKRSGLTISSKLLAVADVVK